MFLHYRKIVIVSLSKQSKLFMKLQLLRMSCVMKIPHTLIATLCKFSQEAEVKRVVKKGISSEVVPGRILQRYDLSSVDSDHMSFVYNKVERREFVYSLKEV